MKDLILIANNLRSSYNVGSLFRSADGAGASKLILTGITPYPTIADDPRPPHISESNSRQIAKVALGAQESVPFEYHPDILEVLDRLKKAGYHLYALEQHPKSRNILTFQPTYPAAIIVGPEVEGIDPKVLERCEAILEIPMRGKKESLNVASAAAIALYRLT